MTEGAASPRWAGLGRWSAALLLPVLLVAYHLLFGRFFPNARGGAGHDYSLALSTLLSGYYWYLASGPLAVPWFTPAFCGGQPFFADVQSVYYSVPQLLTLAWDPLTSCYLTMLAFAALGYAGTYLLLHRRFDVGRPAALLAATVFMFNGFSAHRMVMGHIGFHAFMLVPWLAYWLLAPDPGGSPARRAFGTIVPGCLAGLAAAYTVQSGLGSLVVPVAMAVAILLLLHAISRDAFDVRGLLARSAVGAATAGAVSASKLVAGASFMSSFARSHYLLPGYRTFLDSVRIALLGLFVSPADIEQRSNAVLTNVQWAIARHELEYGVTPVPLVVIVAGGLAAAVALARDRAARRREPWAGRLVAGATIVLLLLVPLLLNTYGVEWNALLKRTPILKSSSSMVRWFAIYIPAVAVLTGLALERLSVVPRAGLAAAGIAAIVLVNFAYDRTYYGTQEYRPDALIRAHAAAARTGAGPPIGGIGIVVGPDGRAITPMDRNDLLAEGASQLLCYNPSFGYGLETFPRADLHPGSVWDVRGGHYNVKNPACYVFPRENRCSPGDHYLLSQREDAERFVHYRPVPFEISRAQAIANGVTRAALVAAALVLLAEAVRRIRRAAGPRRRA